MAHYDLLVPSFFINEIRSQQTDTIFASHSLVVNNASGGLWSDWGAQTVALGDHAKGFDVATDLAFRNVDIPDPTPAEPTGGSVMWTVVLMNQGHGDSGFLDALNVGINVLAGAFAGKFGENVALQIAGKAGDVTSGALEGGWIGAAVAVGLVAAQEALNLLTADCDGQVGAGIFHLTAAQLEAETPAPAGQWTQAQDNPGTNSHAGCGANSDYSVGYRIVRYVGGPVHAPQLHGLSLADASARARQEGLAVSVRRITSGNVESPVVGIQDPFAGTPMPAGAVITVDMIQPWHRPPQ